ncbi:MAG: hypothetical protein U0694_24765 [Anaerolineae bacterium]
MRTFGKWFWRFMIIFSFIVNFVLVVVLLVLGLFIFDIKNQIAQPLVTGLHQTAVGLDNATIDWTIPVRDSIPLDLNIPLETRTTVVLAAAVPLQVDASITLNGQQIPVDVSLSLPEGTALDVYLDLDVPVQQSVPVSLDVRAVIPVNQTQLHDPIRNLGLLFEPLAIGLTNLPNDFTQAGAMVSNVLSGNPPNLLAENDYSRNPWPGYSVTAGLDYPFFGELMPLQNRPQVVGLVPLGGIPALDQQVRPELYANNGNPAAWNAQHEQDAAANGIPANTYDGTMGEYYVEQQAQAETANVNNGVGTGGSEMTPIDANDQGIIPTPMPTPAP